MPKVISLADRLSQMLAFVGAIGVVVMMIHVCTDIVARLVTGASLPATVEIVSYYYMILVAFLPLAWVERNNGMISVELIDFMLTPVMMRISDGVVAALGAVIYAVVAYATWITAADNFETGTFVIALQHKIITWPGYFLPPVGFALAAVVMVVRFIDLVTGSIGHARESGA